MPTATHHVKRALRSNTHIPERQSPEGIFKEIIDKCKLDYSDTKSSDVQLFYHNISPTDGEIITEALKSDSLFENISERKAHEAS